MKRKRIDGPGGKGKKAEVGFQKGVEKEKMKEMEGKARREMRNMTNAIWAKDFGERARMLKDILERLLCDVKILSVVSL